MGINLPNGGTVEEIVLPNGSNASEVIGPDGSTVWERVAIPDSGLAHHWPKTEGSGTTLVDNSGSLDATVNGSSWESGVGMGDFVLNHDGEDDEATVTDSTFGDATAAFRGWLRFDETPDNNSRPYGADDNNGQRAWVLWADGGNIGAFFNNVSGAANNWEPSGFSVSQGTWYFVAFSLDLANTTGKMWAAAASDSSLSDVGTTNDYQDSNGDIAGIQQLKAGAELSNYTNCATDDWHYSPGDTQSKTEAESWFNETKGNYP